MTNKKQLLKGLLATASMAAVVISGAETASAVPGAVNVGNASVSTNTIARPGAAGVPAGGWGITNVGDAADWLDFDNNAAGVILTVNQNNAAIQGIDTNNASATSGVRISATGVQIGSIYDQSGGNGSPLLLTIDSGKDLTLTGVAFNIGNANDYSDLGDITLLGTLNITPAAADNGGLTLGGKINGATGVLTVTSKDNAGNANDGDITLNGNIGATTRITSVTATSAQGDDTGGANKGGGAINFADVKTTGAITATAGRGANSIANAQAGGAITFNLVDSSAGAFTATAGAGGAGGAGGAAGNGGAITVTTTTAAKNLVLTSGNGGVGAANAGGAGGAITLTAGQAITLTGGAASTVTSGNGGAGGAGAAGGVGGAVNIDSIVSASTGAFTLASGNGGDGNANAAANGGDINVGAGILSTFGGDLNITTGNGGTRNAAGNAGNGGNVLFGNGITATGDVNVTLGYDTANSTGGVFWVAGPVTAPNVVLKAANTGGVFGRTNHAIGAQFGGDINGNLVFNADLSATLAPGKKVSGTITNTSGTDNYGAVRFAGATTIAGQIGASGASLKSVALQGAGAVAVKADIYAKDVTANDAATAVTLGVAGAGQTIHGSFSGAAAGDGALSVYGKSGVTGSVGKNSANAGNSIASITFAENNSELTVGGAAVNVNGNIDFNNKQGTTLILTNAGDIAVTGAIVNAVDGQSSVTAANVPAANTLTFNSAVGAANANVNVSAGSGKVSFANAAYVKNLQASEVTLGAAANYQVAVAASGAPTIAHVGANAMTLKTGTNLGSLATLDFATNALVTVEHQVNLTAAQGTASTGNSAKIAFGGDSVFDVAMRSGDSFAQFDITGAGKTVEVKQAVDVSGNAAGLQFTADGTAKLHGNVTGNITTNAVDRGTVVFANEAGTTLVVSGDVGSAGNRLTATTIGAGNVVIGKDAATSAAAQANLGPVTFAQDGTLTIYGAADKFGGSTIKATNAGTGTVSIKDATFAADVGTSTVGLKAVNIMQDGTIQTNGGVMYADITTSDNERGTYIVAAANDKISNIGSSNASLKNVTVNEAATFNGDVYAKDVKAANGIDVKALKGIHGTFTFLGDSKLEVASGSIDKVLASAPVNGSISFTGKVATTDALGDAINTLAGVNFADKSEVTLGGNVFSAGNVTQGISTVRAGSDVTITAPEYVTVSGSVIDAGTNTFTNSAKLTLVGDVKVATTYTSAAAGNVKTGTLDLTGVNSVTFAVSTAEMPKDGTTTFTVATVADAAASLAFMPADVLTDGEIDYTKLASKFAVTNVGSSNRFTSWNLGKVDLDNASIVATIEADRDVQFTTAARSGLSSTSTEFMNKLIAQQNTVDGVAFKILEALGNMTDEQQNTVIGQIMSTTPGVNAAGVSAVSMVTGLTSSAVSNAVKSFASAEGMSAGDSASSMMGAWVKGMFGNETQQKRDATPGFKSNSNAVAVGFDTALTESTVVGITAGNSKTDVKFKNNQVGDTSKANTTFVALYGAQEIMENWIVQGSAMFANSNVKDKAKRDTAVANAKYDAITYGAEVFGGYKFRASDVSTVTPMLGFKYNTTTADSYKETGNTVFLRSVGKRKTDNMVGSLGASVATAAVVNGMDLMPEFHGFVNYNFKNKGAKVNITIDGLDGTISGTGPKATKVSYNLGGNLMAKSGMMEYGVGYDANFGKYVAQQGSLKVRVNF